MPDKAKLHPKTWQQKFLIAFLIFIGFSALALILILHLALTPKQNCGNSRNINGNYTISDIIEPIRTDNIDKLTYLMGYRSIALATTDGGGMAYDILLSDDDQILIVNGIPFTFPTKTFHTGKTIATWELTKDKDEKPFCYLYVGRMGKINREAIELSSDNRYVLLNQGYYQANCLNYACLYVYDRQLNLEIPYPKFSQDVFDNFELNKFGYYIRPNKGSYCLQEFHNTELLQFLTNQLDLDNEFINSLVLSSDNKFAVALLSKKADGYYQNGRIEIWGVVD